MGMYAVVIYNVWTSLMKVIVDFILLALAIIKLLTYGLEGFVESQDDSMVNDCVLSTKGLMFLASQLLFILLFNCNTMEIRLMTYLMR